MEPMLQRIEALPEADCYQLTFTLADSSPRVVVARVRGDAVELPARNVDTGWATDSSSYLAALAVVSAFANARRSVTPAAAVLTDVDGGWDVSLGNVVLDAAGTPTCIAHAEMADVGGGVWECEVCGARAGYGPS